VQDTAGHLRTVSTCAVHCLTVLVVVVEIFRHGTVKATVRSLS